MNSLITSDEISWGNDPVVVESAALAALDDRPGARFSESFRLLDDVEVLELPDPEWLVQDIFPRRGIIAIYAPPGSYKTTLVSGAAVAIAALPDWFGHPIVHHGAVIYVGAEDVSGWKVRLRASKAAAHLPLNTPIGVFTFPDAIDLLDPTSVGRFIRFMQSTGVTAELTIVDTYSAATPGAAENSSEDTTAAMVAAQQIRDALRCSVLIVHHTNAAGSRERGHSGMRGACDVMIAITPVDDVIHVECSKMRNGPPFAALMLKAVPVDAGGVTLRRAAEVLPATSLTTMQAKILGALREIAGQDGVTKAAWRAACPDISERAFYKVANVLEERRFVANVNRHFRIGAGQ